MSKPCTRRFQNTQRCLLTFVLYVYQQLDMDETAESCHVGREENTTILPQEVRLPGQQEQTGNNWGRPIVT